MTNNSTQTSSEELTDTTKFISLRERRKWDAILTVLLFLVVLVASVLFNILTSSEPLIASSGN